MIDAAAAVAAEDAAGVRVVDHHDGAVFFGEVGEFVDGADVAVHGEDAVRDEELVAGFVLDFTEKFFVRCDMTGEFPFLISKMSPYCER